MFVQGKIYGRIDNFPFLDKCISKLRFSDTKTNTPDSKMYHDPYDALFYGSYPYRFKMEYKKLINLFQISKFNTYIWCFSWK